MADKLEEIKALMASVVAKRWFHSVAENDAFTSHLPYLLNRLEAAERYIESDIAYDNAVRHAEYLDAAAARDAREKALERWMAAKGEM